MSALTRSCNAVMVSSLARPALLSASKRALCAWVPPRGDRPGSRPGLWVVPAAPVPGRGDKDVVDGKPSIVAAATAGAEAGRVTASTSTSTTMLAILSAAAWNVALLSP